MYIYIYHKHFSAFFLVFYQYSQCGSCVGSESGRRLGFNSRMNWAFGIISISFSIYICNHMTIYHIYIYIYTYSYLSFIVSEYFCRSCFAPKIVALLSRQESTLQNSTLLTIIWYRWIIIPDAPCMVYWTTFGWFLGQMLVNIPYMEHMGI